MRLEVPFCPIGPRRRIPNRNLYCTGGASRFFMEEFCSRRCSDGLFGLPAEDAALGG
jgi:hypothetical protein